MTTTEKLQLAREIEERNRKAIEALRAHDAEIVRKRVELNPQYPIRKRVKKPVQPDLKALAAKMSKPMTDEQRRKRAHDLAILQAACDADYEPTPLQRSWDILMACIYIWRCRKKECPAV